MVTHQGLVNYLTWAIKNYRVAEGQGSPVHSPVGFDLTVTSLLVPLMVVGTLHLGLPEETARRFVPSTIGGPPWMPGTITVWAFSTASRPYSGQIRKPAEVMTGPLSGVHTRTL